tara:strand:+ start:470 stop:802 length:333 start_codon:yes stop_codon:yes gene_type:complete
MTHEDYKLIADVFSKFQEWHHAELKSLHADSALEWLYGSRLLDGLQNNLMDALASDNPRNSASAGFDRFKFMYASATPSQRERFDITHDDSYIYGDTYCNDLGYVLNEMS